MSTRANVIIHEGGCDKLYFYRHSDGYPEGTLPTLDLFMDWLNKGIIRNNVLQAAGWLVLLGAMEYKSVSSKAFQISAKNRAEMPKYSRSYYEVNEYAKPKDWKVGAYEPTTGIHGDIEYLYIIDLKTKILTYEDLKTKILTYEKV